MTDIPHGTTGGYTNHACRCDECRAASTEHGRKQRAKRTARAADAPHGTYGGYTNWGCRCDMCRGARAQYQRTLRKKA